MGSWRQKGKSKSDQIVTVLNYPEATPTVAEEDEAEELLIPPWMLEPIFLAATTGHFTEEALALWPLPLGAELQ